MLLMVGREVEGYRLAGAERRLVAETGLHLASRVPVPGMPMIDSETTDPALRAALAEGAAWTREEAFEQTLALTESVAQEAPAPT